MSVQDPGFDMRICYVPFRVWGGWMWSGGATELVLAGWLRVTRGRACSRAFCSLPSRASRRWSMCSFSLLSICSRRSSNTSSSPLQQPCSTLGEREGGGGGDGGRDAGRREGERETEQKKEKHQACMNTQTHATQNTYSTLEL